MDMLKDQLSMTGQYPTKILNHATKKLNGRSVLQEMQVRTRLELPVKSPILCLPFHITERRRYCTRLAKRLGYHPFPIPMLRNSVPYGGRPACIRDAHLLRFCLSCKCQMRNTKYCYSSCQLQAVKNCFFFWGGNFF